MPPSVEARLYKQELLKHREHCCCAPPLAFMPRRPTLYYTGLHFCLNRLTSKHSVLLCSAVCLQALCLCRGTNHLSINVQCYRQSHGLVFFYLWEYLDPSLICRIDFILRKLFIKIKLCPFWHLSLSYFSIIAKNFLIITFKVYMRSKYVFALFEIVYWSCAFQRNIFLSIPKSINHSVFLFYAKFLDLDGFWPVEWELRREREADCRRARVRFSFDSSQLGFRETAAAAAFFLKSSWLSLYIYSKCMALC